MNYSRRFILLTAIFIASLITANVVVVKFIAIGPIYLPAAVIVFPVIYILGDIFTEVYGFQRARLVIWLSFLCNLIFVVFAYLVQVLPAAPFWTDQAAYETILGHTPRILIASFAGSLAGQFSNSIIMARVKVLTKGRFLWVRTISSTIVGEFLDSAVFLTLAFFGTEFFVPVVILYHSTMKIVIEVLATPVTYWAVNTLKKTEKLDVFDEKTKFNPFRF